MLKLYDTKTTKATIDYAFGILSNVSHACVDTQWSIVYDMAALNIYFRTLANQRFRYFSLKSFDFYCAAPVKMLDVNADLAGDITAKFLDYTYQTNRNLVRDAYRGTYLMGPFPDHIVDMLANYPESTFCKF
jgi:hypothetical protein